MHGRRRRRLPEEVESSAGARCGGMRSGAKLSDALEFGAQRWDREGDQAGDAQGSGSGDGEAKRPGKVSRDAVKGGERECEEQRECEWACECGEVVAQRERCFPGCGGEARKNEEEVDDGERHREANGAVGTREPEREGRGDESADGQEDEPLGFRDCKTNGIDGDGKIGGGGADGEPAKERGGVGPVGTEEEAHDVVGNSDAEDGERKGEMSEEIGGVAHGGRKIRRSGGETRQTRGENLGEWRGDVGDWECEELIGTVVETGGAGAEPASHEHGVDLREDALEDVVGEEVGRGTPERTNAEPASGGRGAPAANSPGADETDGFGNQQKCDESVGASIEQRGGDHRNGANDGGPGFDAVEFGETEIASEEHAWPGVEPD